MPSPPSSWLTTRARTLGYDIDKTHNMAKSITVELARQLFAAGRG
jgi:hypothetical protein